MIFSKVLFFILVSVFSCSVQAQEKRVKDSAFLEFGVSGNGGFLKNEYGDFKYGTGTGFFWNIAYCFGNHCVIRL
ncbi:hypothetical protein KKD49_03005 [Myxococcota bacterium]|nr:hypothetical protein [Myxococcota bacterium]